MDDPLKRFLNLKLSADEFKSAINQSITLSYQLLCYLNTSKTEAPELYSSIQQATYNINKEQLETWASITPVKQANPSNEALIIRALTRARFCESTAKALNDNNIESFYSVGLLSMLDMVVNDSIDNIIEKLPLNEELSNAIVKYNGIMGETLNACLMLEKDEWDSIKFPYISKAALNMNYRNALQWAEDISKQHKSK